MSATLHPSPPPAPRPTHRRNLSGRFSVGSPLPASPYRHRHLFWHVLPGLPPRASPPGDLPLLTNPLRGSILRAPFSLIPGTQRLQVQARGAGDSGEGPARPHHLALSPPMLRCLRGQNLTFSLAKSTSQREKMQVLLSLGKAFLCSS